MLLGEYVFLPTSDGDEPIEQAERHRVPLVLDHFAQPDLSSATDPSNPAGFSTLLRILSNPSSNLYVKISAAYRLLPRAPPTPASTSPLRDLFNSLLDAAETRVVFGSDWPHTRYDTPGEVDTIGWIEDVVRWCVELKGEGEDGRRLIERVFKTNAEELWFGRD
jgi:predicted TIM-barrel fold metal-dependent hydrolase